MTKMTATFTATGNKGEKTYQIKQGGKVVLTRNSFNDYAFAVVSTGSDGKLMFTCHKDATGAERGRRTADGRNLVDFATSKTKYPEIFVLPITEASPATTPKAPKAPRTVQEALTAAAPKVQKAPRLKSEKAPKAAKTEKAPRTYDAITAAFLAERNVTTVSGLKPYDRKRLAKLRKGESVTAAVRTYDAFTTAFLAARGVSKVTELGAYAQKKLRAERASQANQA